MKRMDNKLTLVKIKFLTVNYKSLSKKNISKLSNSAKDLFHFVKRFGDLLSEKYYISIYILEDPIHDIESAKADRFSLTFINTFSVQK